MDDVFGTVEDFNCGRIFKTIKITTAVGKSFENARSKAKRVVRNSVAIPAMFFAVGIAFLPNSAALAFSAANVLHVPIGAVEDLVELRENFRNARKFLGLTQVETAGMLHIAPSSLRKFEQGTVLYPSKGTVARYRTITGLADLYRGAFGDDPTSSHKMLHEAGFLFEGKPPLKYAIEGGPDGIFNIVSMHKRILA